MDAAPAWLTDFNRQRNADKFAAKAWNRLIDDVGVVREVRRQGCHRRGARPHRHHVPASVQRRSRRRRSTTSSCAGRRSPTRSSLDFSLEAMKQHELGKDADTDILAIGFAATDGIGHQWGPDSQEQMDQMLRLDGVLGRLFEQVDSTVGLENTLIVLSADHGSRPLVEILQMRGCPGAACRRRRWRVLVRTALAKRYPGVTDLVSYFATDVYFNEDAVRRHRARTGKRSRRRPSRPDVNGRGRERIHARRSPKTSRSLRSIPRIVQESVLRSARPHLNVLLKPGVYVNSAVGGTGHGTAYDVDRHVPVIFMGRDIKPGRYTHESAPEDIAPRSPVCWGSSFRANRTAVCSRDARSAGQSAEHSLQTHQRDVLGRTDRTAGLRL